MTAPIIISTKPEQPIEFSSRLPPVSHLTNYSRSSFSSSSFAIKDKPIPQELGNGNLSFEYLLDFTKIALASYQRRPVPFQGGRDRQLTVSPFAFNQVHEDFNGSWIGFFERDLLVEYSHFPAPYIATCAPQPSHFSSFMRILETYNCTLVVTLTNPMEADKLKADVYLPSAYKPIETVEYKIHLIEEKTFAPLSNGWIIRESQYELQLANKEVSHRFTNLHVSNWTDGSPGTVDALKRLCELTKEIQQKNSSKGPIVVHCSAGIGRTGEFIGCHQIFSCNKRVSDRDIFTLAVQMKMQRIGLGGNKTQYEMLYAFRDKIYGKNVSEPTELPEKLS